MKRLMIFILVAFVSCAAFARENPPASKASIEQLLELTETKQMYETAMQEMTKMIDQSTERIMSSVPDGEQGKLKQAMSQLDAIFKDEISWDKMKPEYIRVYAETFTQQEIDDLAAFYKTPSGKSFIKKQPLVIQRMTALSQEKMLVIMKHLTGMMPKAMAGK